MPIVMIAPGKWINTQHAVSITRLPSDGSLGERFSFVMINGDTENSAPIELDADWEEYTAEVFPAAHEQIAIELVLDYHPRRRPVAEDVRSFDHVVIGWRVSRNGIEPIVLEPRGLRSMLLIRQPDGRYTEVGGFNYPTIDKAIKDFVKSAQITWDEINQKAESTPT